MEVVPSSAPPPRALGFYEDLLLRCFTRVYFFLFILGKKMCFFDTHKTIQGNFGGKMHAYSSRQAERQIK